MSGRGAFGRFVRHRTYAYLPDKLNPDDAVTLAERTDDYRVEYNQIRPHEAIAWNRPEEVHLGLAEPTTPTFHTNEVLPTT